MDLKEIWRASTNRDPAVEDIERIKNIMRSADMGNNDSMAVVLTLISAQQSNAPSPDTLSSMIVGDLSTKIAKEIKNQVNEQRQVATISQQLRVVAFTTVVNLMILGIIYMIVPSNNHCSGKVKIEIPQWAEGCDTNSNMPIMAIEDKGGEKKCVLIGKDGKSARDQHGKAITWSIN